MKDGKEITLNENEVNGKKVNLQDKMNKLLTKFSEDKSAKVLEILKKMGVNDVAENNVNKDNENKAIMEDIKQEPTLSKENVSEKQEDYIEPNEFEGLIQVAGPSIEDKKPVKVINPIKFEDIINSRPVEETPDFENSEESDLEKTNDEEVINNQDYSLENDDTIVPESEEVVHEEPSEAFENETNYEDEIVNSKIADEDFVKTMDIKEEDDIMPNEKIESNFNGNLEKLQQFETYDDYVETFRKVNVSDKDVDQFYRDLRHEKHIPSLLTKNEFIDLRRKEIEDDKHQKQNQQIIDLRKRLNTTKEKLEEAKEEQRRLKTQNEDVTSKLDKERTSRVNAENKKTDLEAALEEQKVQIADYRRKNETLSNDVNALRRDNFETRKAATLSESEIRKLNNIIKQKEEEIEDLNTQIETLKDEKAALQTKFESLTSRVQGELSRVANDTEDEKKNKPRSVKNSDLDNSVSESNHEKSRANDELESLKKAKDALKSIENAQEVTPKRSRKHK